MNTDVKIITKDEHLNTKVKDINSYKFAKSSNQTIISVDEFAQASKSQPIVFLKGGDGELFASVILAFEPKTNVFVDKDGKWEEREYIPAVFRRYPFIFVQNGETLALGVDYASGLVNEKKGNALFDKEGNPTEFTNKKVEFLNGFHRANMLTVKFVKELDELGLLEDASAKLAAQGDNIEFKGFKKVDEKKLQELPDEQILKLVKSGAYKLIQLHLASLLNFENIAILEKKNKK